VLGRNFSGNPLVKGFYGTLNTYPFSNHASVPTRFKGVWYKTSEHAYLAEQAREYGLHQLAAAWTKGTGSFVERGRRYDWANPKRVKAYSTVAFRPFRNPNHPARQSWLAKRRTIMFQIVLSKYRGNATARAALLRTGHQFLVEASPHDDFWGIGTSLPKDPHALDKEETVPDSWGQNRLGHITMAVRNLLRQRVQRTKELTMRAKRHLVARAHKHGAIHRQGLEHKMPALQAKGAFVAVAPAQDVPSFDPLEHFARQLVPGVAKACRDSRRQQDYLPVISMPYHLRPRGPHRKRRPNRDPEEYAHRYCMPVLVGK
jgi:ribA/ribD-fused uncharacterized protein